MGDFLGITSDLLKKIALSSLIVIFSPFKVSMLALLCLIILDTLFGFLYALRIRQASRRGFSKCFKKTFTYSAAIVTIRLVEIGIGSIVQTTVGTHLITGFLILSEGMSVLKNLTLLDVPLPEGIIKAITESVKFLPLKDMLDKNSVKQEYMEDVKRLMYYHLPYIKSKKTKRLLKIMLEEWTAAINTIDIQLQDGNIDNNDIIYYRVSGIIAVTNNLIDGKWKESNIPNSCVNAFQNWYSPRAEKHLEILKGICYSQDQLSEKRKKIIEAVVVELYKVIEDLVKDESVLYKNNCHD